MSIRKFFYILVCSVAIALLSILSALLFLTSNLLLQILSLLITYSFGIYFVKTKNEYI